MKVNLDFQRRRENGGPRLDPLVQQILRWPVSKTYAQIELASETNVI